MKIQELGLENYRNFSANSFKFEDKNIVIGKNGAGKSNLIEAIRFISVGKSFKTSRLDEIISFEKGYFRIQTTLKDKLVDYFFGREFDNSPIKNRKLLVDNNDGNFMDFVGVFPTVLFTPVDIGVVVGPPQSRRRFLDGVLWQVDKKFRFVFVETLKILKERAALLFLIKINRAAPDELEPWNEMLIKNTKFIRQRRSELVEFFNIFLADNNDINLQYSFQDQDITELLNQEVRSSQNIYGPHRDELEIVFKGKMAKTYASRGQARFIITLVKLAEANFLSEKLGELPVVLLDDMFSELDGDKSLKLLDDFSAKYQVIASSIKNRGFDNSWQEIAL